MSDKIVLRKAGYPDMTIRQSGEGYEMLAYTYRGGQERWAKIRMSNEDVEKEIAKYRVE